MAEELQQGIRISVTQDSATAIGILKSQIQDLYAFMAKSSGVAVASAKKEIDAIQAEIAAIKNLANVAVASGQTQVYTSERVTSAMVEAANKQAAATVNASQRSTAAVANAAEEQVAISKRAQDAITANVIAANEAQAAATRAAAIQRVALAGIKPAAGLSTAEIIAQNTGLATQAGFLQKHSLSYSELIALKNEEAAAATRQAVAEAQAAAAMSAARNAAMGESRSLADVIALRTGAGAAPAFSASQIAQMSVGWPTARGRGQALLRSSLGNVAAEGEAAGTGFWSSFMGAVRSVQPRRAISFIDEMMRHQRGQMAATVGATIKDMSLGAGALALPLGGLAAVLGGAAILRGAENMGALARSIRAGASAAGMSVEDYSRLTGALQLMGLKGNEADAALRQFAKNLETAARDPTSRQATDLRALGISQEQIVAGTRDVHGALMMVIEAMSRYKDSAAKSTVGTDMFGRSYEKLAPMLDEGASSFKALEAEAESLGLTMTRADSGALIKTQEQIEKLSNVIKGQAIQAFIAWSPTIQNVLKDLTEIGSTVGKAVTEIGKMDDAITEFIAKHPTLGKVFDAGSAALNPAKTVFSEIQRLTAGSKSSTDQSGVTVPIAGGQTDLILPASDKAQRQGIRDIKATLALQVAEARGSSAQIAAAYDEALNELKSKYADDVDDYKRIQAEKLRAVQTAVKAETAARKRALNEEQQAELQAIRDRFDASKAVLSTTRTQSAFQMAIPGQQVSPQMRSAQSEQDSQKIISLAQQEIQALEQIETAADTTSKVRQQAALDVLSTVKEAETQIEEMYNKTTQAAKKAALDQAKPFIEAFDKIGSQAQSFSDSMMKALLMPQRELIHAGLTTIKVNLQGNEIRAAASKFFLGLADDMVSSVTKGITQLAAQGLGKLLLSQGQQALLGPNAGIGGVLGMAVSGASGSTNAAAMGMTTANLQMFNAALTQATATLAGHSATTTVATATTGAQTAAMTTSAVSTMANTASTSVNTVSTVANTAATNTSSTSILAMAGKAIIAGIEFMIAGIKALAFEGGGVVPSAAGGMVVGGLGGRGVLSVLHPQEMVLPARLSNGVQAMINSGRTGGGNSAHLNYSPTINMGGRAGVAELGSLLSSHSGQLMGEARNMLRKGWRP